MIFDFICNLELLDEQSKLELRTVFQDVEVAIMRRMKKDFDQLNERCKSYSTHKKLICQYNTEKFEISTHYLKQYLQRNVEILAVFGFNSSRRDSILTISSFSLFDSCRVLGVGFWEQENLPALLLNSI